MTGKSLQCLRSVLLALAIGSIAATSGAQQTTERFEATFERKVVLDYLLSVPEDYSDDGAPVPLLLFLHGAGERGSDVERVKTHGPPRLLEQGKDIPAIVVSPQCPDDSWWTEHLEALSLLLDQLIERYNVDESRIYLTGLSMGGYGTWALAAREPERFAAAVPICGGGSIVAAFQLRSMPIRVYHGDADPVVPLSESERLVKALEARGGNVELTVYPGVGHDSWTRTYDDPELWEWLFAQRRE